MQETVVKTICVNLKCNVSSEKDPKLINMSHWRYIFVQMNFKREEIRVYLSEVQLGSFI